MKSRLNTYLSFYNLSQAELAEATNINRNTIGRYCNDTFERIDKSHIDALCSFFRVSFESLFETDYNFPIKYPSPVIEQSIKSMPVPHNFVVTTGINLETMQEEILTYVKSDNFEDPTSDMAPEEYEDYTKELSKIHQRFDLELFTDKLVSKFIDKIIDFLITHLKLEDYFKKTLLKHKGYDYFNTSTKVEKIYKTFYNFFQYYEEKENENFIKYLVNIEYIYTHGGLSSLSDEELNDLYNNMNSLNKTD